MRDLLTHDRVYIHPFVIGEISLGSLRDRAIVLRSLGDLPHVPVATPEEVLYLVEQERISSRGIGYVDASLLAAARLQPGVTIWTRDKRLRKIAEELAVAAVLEH
jgi:predicted nucleic acid-binding protein